MLTKVCTKCSVEKTVDNFNKATRMKDGFVSKCKVCKAIDDKRYYENNRESRALKMKIYYEAKREHLLTQMANYRKDNSESIAMQKRNYRKNNNESVALQKKQWRQNNPDKRNAGSARHRAFKKQAKPSWADQQTIEGMYKLAMMFNRTGLDMHVDHIVPLNSDKVCGLHCEANLQLLLASDNISKGNRWWPDMW